MTDRIEEVRFGVDLDANDRPQGYLAIAGDFTETCEAYLADADASKLLLTIDRSAVEDFIEQVAPHLGFVREEVSAP